MEKENIKKIIVEQESCFLNVSEVSSEVVEKFNEFLENIYSYCSPEHVWDDIYMSEWEVFLIKMKDLFKEWGYKKKLKKQIILNLVELLEKFTQSKTDYSNYSKIQNIKAEILANADFFYESADVLRGTINTYDASCTKKHIIKIYNEKRLKGGGSHKLEGEEGIEKIEKEVIGSIVQKYSNKMNEIMDSNEKYKWVYVLEEAIKKITDLGYTKESEFLARVYSAPLLWMMRNRKETAQRLGIEDDEKNLSFAEDLARLAYMIGKKEMGDFYSRIIEKNKKND